MARGIVIAAALLLCVSPGLRAAGPKLGWRVDGVAVEGRRDSLAVSVTYSVLDWNVDPSGAAVFSPKVEHGPHFLTLTPVSVYGRRAVSQSQKGAVSGNEAEHQILNFRGPVTFTLTDVLPLQEWMDTVRVTLADCSWTRRGGLTQNSKRTLETFIRDAAPDVEMDWDLVAPRASNDMYRSYELALPVAFSGAEVSTDRCAEQLDSLAAVAASFTSARRVTLHSAEVAVWTDPAGQEKNNLALSRRRAASVYTLLRKRGCFRNITPVRSGMGEDWSGMERWLDGRGYMEGRVEEILASSSSRDAMEDRLRREQPMLWELMDSACFPLLSRAVLKVSYRKPAFRDTESLGTFYDGAPWMLEAFDFWRYAMSFDRRSDECLDILLKGLEYWPGDEELNLDAALALMDRDMLVPAMVCLRSAGEGLHADYARAVWLYLSGRYAESRELFRGTAGRGVPAYDRAWESLERYEDWSHGLTQWRRQML